MADQLPMMISLFILKQTAELLSTDILGLLDGANASELLFEDSDVSKRRKDIQTRLARLTAAQAALNEFIWGICWLEDITWKYIISAIIILFVNVWQLFYRGLLDLTTMFWFFVDILLDFKFLKLPCNHF